MSSVATQISIRQTFDALRQRQRIAFMPFVPAGYPDLKTTEAVLPALEAGGANLIEVGIPFSDPIADGPTVQAAFTEALSKGLHVRDVFSTIRNVRGKVSIPLVAMVSFSIVYRYGTERFFREAKEAGFDGAILPDLPPPEAEATCRLAQSIGLETVLLVAPTTSAERRKQIAQLSSGFVYYLSVTGITGERDRLPADLEDNVRQLKSLTDRPICVGFGISTARHVAQLATVANGAIVGSAIVKRMKQNESQGPRGVAQAIEQYCRELLSELPPAR